MTDEDCDEAYDLRNKEDDDERRRECEIEQYCKEEEEYRAKLERELTPEEYKWWEVDEDFAYHDRQHEIDSMFNRVASDAARYYYIIHQIMLPDGDFVSNEWGAERKIDKVMRERKQNEKK